MKAKSADGGELPKLDNISDLQLLSSSFDFTVGVWGADEETNQWQVKSTFGAMAGNKHAYFGAKFLDYEG